jgi:uncharacterized membrane protein
MSMRQGVSIRLLSAFVLFYTYFMTYPIPMTEQIFFYLFFFTVFYSSSDASLAEILFLFLYDTQSNILAPFR